MGWRARIVDAMPGSTPGSRFRNLFSYVIAGVSLGLVIETIAASFGYAFFTWIGAAWFFLAVSVMFFGAVVVGVIFLTSQHFRLSPTRLARDTMLSIIFTILVFALFHRISGITLTGICPEEYSPADALYFSAVTFSTLGYGDFRPCPTATARLVAAFQAIFGNLHLGLVVGAAFFFAQEQGSTPANGRLPDEEVNDATKDREG